METEGYEQVLGRLQALCSRRECCSSDILRKATASLDGDSALAGKDNHRVANSREVPAQQAEFAILLFGGVRAVPAIAVALVFGIFHGGFSFHCLSLGFYANSGSGRILPQNANQRSDRRRNARGRDERPGPFRFSRGGRARRLAGRPEGLKSGRARLRRERRRGLWRSPRHTPRPGPLRRDQAGRRNSQAKCCP